MSEVVFLWVVGVIPALLSAAAIILNFVGDSYLRRMILGFAILSSVVLLVLAGTSTVRTLHGTGDDGVAVEGSVPETVHPQATEPPPTVTRIAATATEAPSPQITATATVAPTRAPKVRSGLESLSVEDAKLAVLWGSDSRPNYESGSSYKAIWLRVRLKNNSSFEGRLTWELECHVLKHVGDEQVYLWNAVVQGKDLIV